MATIDSRSLNQRLFEALNINQKYITEINISMKANDIVKVSVESIMEDEQADNVMKLLKEYYLVEKPDGKR
jgi:hypothetical protein